MPQGQRLVAAAALKKTSRRQRPLLMLVAMLGAVVVLSTTPEASAQTWRGTNSSDWNDRGNWSGNAVPTTGTVAIEKKTPHPTVLGVSGAATATSGALRVGTNAGSSGDLTIKSSSTLATTGLVRIGEDAGAMGVVTVTDPGSTWTITGTAGTTPLIVGNSAKGTLTVSNGGAVSALVGIQPVIVGRASTGTLSVQSGGTFSANAMTIGGFNASNAAGNGTVIVDGSGSQLTVAGALVIGGFGTGELDIQSSGTVTAQSGAVVASRIGSSGTLNISSAGVLETPSLAGGTGVAQVKFDDGTLKATANNASFITGFTGGELNIAAGGLTVDTAGHTIATDATSAFTGAGGLTVTGGGTLTLAAANTYAGPTVINDGTLLINGSIVSATTVNPGGTLGGNGTIFNGVDNYGNVAPGNSIGDLTIIGAYVGFGGTLTIESILAGNSSPIDHLILSGATASASGTTGIVVVNLFGSSGAQTTGNGIPVVITTGGATTTASAFHLAGPVGAGPFQYLLFRGPQGAGTGDENTWYLRSHTTANAGGEGGGDGGGGVPIPLYRPETASYALFPALARSLAVSTIGSFHERNGDQALAGGSKRERMWGRIFGERIEQSHGGHVTPSFEGHAAGFQAGADAYETVWENGMRGRAGVFVGWAEARGDIKGFVLGDLQAFAGDAQLEATSVGGYGTLVGPGGWYLDGIVMPSFYSGDGRSTNGIGVNADGWSLLGSLEAGIPFRLGGGFTLEPQAQLIYQHLDFDDAADPFSTVRFNTPDAVSGRIGVRLAGELAQGRVRPYLKANLWQDWLDKDGIIYAGTHRLDTEHGGTAVEVGGGVVAELMPGVGLWGVVDYTTDIAGDTERETWRGNAGVRITW